MSNKSIQDRVRVLLQKEASVSKDKPDWYGDAPDLSRAFDGKRERQRLTRAMRSPEARDIPGIAEPHKELGGKPLRWSQVNRLGLRPDTTTPEGLLRDKGLLNYCGFRHVYPPEQAFQRMEEAGYPEETREYIHDLIEQGIIRANVPGSSTEKVASDRSAHIRRRILQVVGD